MNPANKKLTQRIFCLLFGSFLTSSLIPQAQGADFPDPEVLVYKTDRFLPQLADEETRGLWHLDAAKNRDSQRLKHLFFPAAAASPPPLPIPALENRDISLTALAHKSWVATNVLNPSSIAFAENNTFLTFSRNDDTGKITIFGRYWGVADPNEITAAQLGGTASDFLTMITYVRDIGFVGFIQTRAEVKPFTLQVPEMRPTAEGPRIKVSAENFSSHVGMEENYRTTRSIVGGTTHFALMGEQSPGIARNLFSKKIEDDAPPFALQFYQTSLTDGFKAKSTSTIKFKSMPLEGIFSKNDDYFAVTLANGELNLIRYREDESWQIISWLNSPVGYSAMAFSPDGKSLIVVDNNNALFHYDIARESIIPLTVTAACTYINKIFWRNDGMIILAEDHGPDEGFNIIHCYLHEAQLQPIPRIYGHHRYTFHKDAASATVIAEPGLGGMWLVEASSPLDQQDNATLSRISIPTPSRTQLHEAQRDHDYEQDFPGNLEGIR